MKNNNFLRQELLTLIQKGYIKPKDLDKALNITAIIPSSISWRTFIDTLLLWIGSLAIAFSLLFFVAFNWSDIGRFAQFGLVEVGIVMAIAFYYFTDQTKLLNNISLFIASMLVGVLLALFGQTYQTGADTWQLFFYWALLISPWVVLGRFSALWLLWVALLNLSIILYFKVFQNIFWTIFDADNTVLWSLFIFNLLVHIFWEFLLKHTTQDKSSYWAIRVVAIASGVLLTWLVLIGIIEPRASSVLATFVWFLYMSAIYIMYKNVKHDLFILAGGCLSAIVVIMTFLSMHLLKGFHAGGFFILTFFIVGLGAGCAYWLKNLHKEWNV